MSVPKSTDKLLKVTINIRDYELQTLVEHGPCFVDVSDRIVSRVMRAASK